MAFGVIRRGLWRAIGLDPNYKRYNEELRELSSNDKDLRKVVQFKVDSVRCVRDRCWTLSYEDTSNQEYYWEFKGERVDGEPKPTLLFFPGPPWLHFDGVIDNVVDAHLFLGCCRQNEVNSSGGIMFESHLIRREIGKIETPYYLEWTIGGVARGQRSHDIYSDIVWRKRKDCFMHEYVKY